LTSRKRTWFRASRSSETAIGGPPLLDGSPETTSETPQDQSPSATEEEKRKKERARRYVASESTPVARN
jgi:hypothetical protein